ncbi:MAG TPA: threonine--tRNA ligase, partial [Candidatus Paceibacterota bacterium]|nr:threonine--tRNA ligase [Candidatus Paceibacterota bacterium]
LGGAEKWIEAEGMLRQIVLQKEEAEGVEWFEGIGEAAFYGPKLDFMAKDALGREWQVATIQLDMNQPERFDLFCVNENGEHERIVMIHAAIMGSIDRFLSVLIEHTGGAFPAWLAPVQAAVLPVSDKFSEYGKRVCAELLAHDVRVEFSEATESLGKRIRAAEMMKVPYILVVGEKEEKNGTVAVRSRKGDEGAVPTKQFLEKIQRETRERAR